jgi:transposase
MVAVVIGVDPHKGSHTAVAISPAEEQLGELRVRASAVQAQRLLDWAAAWPQRTWAIEGAGGLGHLLAQQLLAAGERVLDVQPRLGARVRLLASSDTNKNDRSDARSVAIAALRSPARRQVQPDDHAAVLKVSAKRHRDLGPDPGCLPAACGVVRAGGRWRLQGDHCWSCCPPSGIDHPAGGGGGSPLRARRGVPR